MSDMEQQDETDTLEPELLGQKSWSRQAQGIASVVWPSFIAATAGMMVAFMFIDPELLGVALMPEREISALTGYGLCFFLFWVIALIASSTTMFLRRTRRREHEDSSQADSGRS